MKFEAKTGADIEQKCYHWWNGSYHQSNYIFWGIQIVSLTRLINLVRETIENGAKEQKVGFFSILGTLVASS